MNFLEILFRNFPEILSGIPSVTPTKIPQGLPSEIQSGIFSLVSQTELLIDVSEKMPGIPSIFLTKLERRRIFMSSQRKLHGKLQVEFQGVSGAVI